MYKRQCGNLRNNIQNLELYVQKSRALAMRGRREAYIAELRKQKKGFVTVAPLPGFLDQFKTPRDRAKCLVLDGPSQTGKTAFCLWLYDNPEKTMVVNCSGVASEPDLRPFVENDTRLILFDECTPALMATYRKIFQGPAYDLVMGQSATNTFTYTRFLAGTPMIIAANDWGKKLRAMDRNPDTRGDADWVRQNTIHVWVPKERPLYLTSEDAGKDPRTLFVDYYGPENMEREEE